MKVLAFDTALFGCSVAFYDEGGAQVTEQKRMPRGQAEFLVPMVQDVMAKAEADFTDLDLIATTVGPGAFTGLRIGLATAQGFGLAVDKPVIGVTTLETLAAMFFEKEKLQEGQSLCVLIETKRQDYYCQFFDADGKAESEPIALGEQAVIDAASGKDVVYIGDALERFPVPNGKGVDSYDMPDAVMIAKLAIRKTEDSTAEEAVPLYLRDADVSAPKKKYRTIE